MFGSWKAGGSYTWSSNKSADHPNLIAKAICTYAPRQRGDVLLEPLTQGRQLVNLQRIHPDGARRFLNDDMVKTSNTHGAPPAITCKG